MELKLSNINYEIDDKKILQDINLTFTDNEITVITGQNGSGKSTLAKIIMGIITPTSGKILFNGIDITKMSLPERARLGFSIAFQQPISFKGLTIKQLLEIASGKDLTLNEGCELLSKVGLCARNYLAREFNKSLSGGELKRVEIAMLLAKNGCVNIFDEPEAGIDLWSFENLSDILEKLNKDKITIIVSHQEKILQIADKIIVLNGSKISQEGGKEILQNIKKSLCEKLSEGV